MAGLGGTVDEQVIRSRRQPARFARSLFAPLPGRYDLLAEILSFGQNRRWRAKMVAAVPVDPDATVLDVATGPGGVARRLVQWTGSQVIGLDLTPEMLARAAQLQASDGDRRIHLVAGRAEELPFAGRTFDALTFTYLLRYVADPAATTRELARVVRPGGVIASLDFAVPTSWPLRALWHFYTRAVLPVGGWLLGGRAWWDVGRFLGPSISGHDRDHPPASIERAWREAGITDIETRTMSFGGGRVMWGRVT